MASIAPSNDLAPCIGECGRPRAKPGLRGYCRRCYDIMRYRDPVKRKGMLASVQRYIAKRLKTDPEFRQRRNEASRRYKQRQREKKLMQIISV